MTPNEETLNQPENHATHDHTTHHVHHKEPSKLTTPVAIIIGAVILALGMVGYGLVTSDSGSSAQGVNNPLPKMLKTLSVNKKDFDKCVLDSSTASIVTESTNDGIKAGVNGTPTTFILKDDKGVLRQVAMVTGAQTQEFLQQAINEAINTTKLSTFPVFKGRAVDASDHKEGDSTSGIYIVEYSDTECPFCISFHNTIKQIRTEFADTGKATFVYRYFPLTQIHPHAQNEAKMLVCVGKIGGDEKFYKFIDTIFEFKLTNNVGFLPVVNQQ